MILWEYSGFTLVSNLALMYADQARRLKLDLRIVRGKHSDKLTIVNLALTYRSQGHFREAEETRFEIIVIS